MSYTYMNLYELTSEQYMLMCTWGRKTGRRLKKLDYN